MTDAAKGRQIALALHRRGRLAEAEAAYRALLASDARDGETWHYLAVLSGAHGRAADVVACERRALDCGYVSASVHFNLARALASQGNILDGGAAAAKAVRLAPDDFELLADVRSLLRASGHERELLDGLLRQARAGASDRRQWSDIGELAAEMGVPGLAHSAFSRAAEMAPGDHEAWFNLATFYNMTGDAKQAEQAARRGLAAKPDFHPLYFLLIQLRDFQPQDPIFRSLSDLLGSPAGAASAPLRFATARLFDRIDDVDRAFRHYEAGNRIVRSAQAYDAPGAEAAIAELGAMVRARDFAAAPVGEQAGDDKVVPIFIVGLPRSGSTLIEQILASHSNVSTSGEMVWLQRFTRMVLDESGLRFPSGLARLGSVGEDRIRSNYLRVLQSRRGNASYVVDKLPANLLYVPLIAKLFPSARVVVSIRDPLENCWSCYKHLFAGPQHFAYNLLELARYHNACRGLIADYEKHLAGRLRIVRHEQLLAAPESEVAALLDFCGLAWEESCLDFRSGSRLVRTASSLQVRRPLRKEAGAEARRYAKFLGPLGRALRSDSFP